MTRSTTATYFMQKELARRKQENHLRFLVPVTPCNGVMVKRNGQSLINFCSNDYLGLARHPLLRERAKAFMDRYGAGATASRLVCGTLPCAEAVEEKLARLKGAEAALIFNSGFQANLSLLPALADKKSLILSDRLNHRSIIEGARLCRCALAVFRHNDMAHLEEILHKSRYLDYSRIFIVTESIFSMDGDSSDVKHLVEMARNYGAILVVDEAHATGVAGARGMGLTAGTEVDCCMGTFGKALGSFGAYGTFSKEMRDYLINCCSGFIYSTALPPSVMGAVDAALDLVPEMDRERKQLMEKARDLRAELHRMGWDTGSSATHIIPIIVGSEAETLALAGRLEDAGILAMAIRPPTVEKGRSRIRLALTALHTDQHLNRLIDALDRWKRTKQK